MPEKERQSKISKCCCHKKNRNNILQLFNSIYYCMICSTFTFNNIAYKTIIPNNFKKIRENPPNLHWLTKQRNSYNFINKKDYLKLRSSIIKNIKKICSFFSLSLKTYFLSVEYFDNICSKTKVFSKNTLFQISLICINLASKFIENKTKSLEVQLVLKEKASKNYLEDEIYILQLLNYNLNIYTSYDILMDILFYGFIFENEDFNYEKLNLFYFNIEKILYTFSESNYYIDMTPKQIAISLIAFSRKLLNLNPFSENIKKIFMIKDSNENSYITGLKIIEKKIKIKNI